MNFRYLLHGFALMVMVGSSSSTLLAEYPEKPIKIVVYTAPGGLIDVTSRKIAAIMQSRYTSVPVVVENKKGAGGLIALQHVLRQRPDGYTVFGLTSSVITRTVSAKKQSMLSDLHYLLRVVDDYEGLIVKDGGELSDAQAIIGNAKQKKGAQIWVGPAAGGTDHIFAKKFWKASGISAKWIPYRSGGEAMASLLGGHGSVYVGNPADVVGRTGLKLAAVSSPERLTGFPDTPTFKELGLDSLTGESLWRGYAIRKDVDSGVAATLTELFQKVAKDSEWLEFLRKNSIHPLTDNAALFASAVESQIESDKKHLDS
jgi:tripartite-type tricarboxylate transporter receptor subunit TctC